METKIALSGKFSSYELICEADGKIMCHNLKDNTTQHLCTFDPSYVHASFRSDRYKNLKKWIERKVKILAESVQSRRRHTMTTAEKVDIINQFYSTLKSEVREYKLKELN